MKILHVMAGSSHGGAETFFTDCIEALHEAGVEQAVVTRNNNDHKIDIFKRLNIPFQTTGFKRLWPFPTSKSIKDMSESFKPDITQYWMGRAGQFSMPSNGVNVAWYGGYYNPVKFKHADVHVGVTKDIQEHIVKKGVDEKNAYVLHTYAEFPNEPPVRRADFQTPEDAPLLLALSRLHWKKGLDVLLQSMAKIPHAYLWIAGDGPLEDELKTLCTHLGLDNRVRFLGWRNDRGALLSAADVCVFPSRYEPFGTVTVEAWGRGVPLVAAKSAGPKAFIHHGTDGMLVEIDDVDGLAKAINEIIDSPALAKDLIAGGFESYNKGFSKDVFKQKALAFYNGLLSRKKET